MKISAEAIIPREKLLNYLLLPMRRNDKSRFLARAGFTRNNPEALEAALYRMAERNDGYIDRADDYGIFFRVEGELHGPDGMLNVVTIWMWHEADGIYRFVTLKPAG